MSTVTINEVDLRQLLAVVFVAMSEPTHKERKAKLWEIAGKTKRVRKSLIDLGATLAMGDGYDRFLGHSLFGALRLTRKEKAELRQVGALQ